MQVGIITRRTTVCDRDVLVQDETCGQFDARLVWRYAANREASAEICRSAYSQLDGVTN